MKASERVLTQVTSGCSQHSTYSMLSFSAHLHTQTHIHTQTQTHTHTQTHTQTRRHVRMHASTYAFTYTHHMRFHAPLPHMNLILYTRTHIHTYQHSTHLFLFFIVHLQILPCSYTTHERTSIHTRTRTHMHVHTHTSMHAHAMHAHADIY